MSKHPNATAGGVAGGVSVLLVYLAGLAGLELSPEVATAAGSLIIAGTLFVGRNGLRGLWQGGK